jgi:hypothetical protein
MAIISWQIPQSDTPLVRQMFHSWLCHCSFNSSFTSRFLNASPFSGFVISIHGNFQGLESRKPDPSVLSIFGDTFGLSRQDFSSIEAGNLDDPLFSVSTRG